MKRTERYAAYRALQVVERQHGVLELVMGAGKSANRKLSTADDEMHRELANIWRDIDTETPATNLELRDQAVDQLDVALLHGVSRIVAARLAAAQVHEGVERDADWAFLKILGPVLDRDATTRDAAQAATLRQAFAAASFDAVDVDAALAALTALYPCP